MSGATEDVAAPIDPPVPLANADGEIAASDGQQIRQDELSASEKVEKDLAQEPVRVAVLVVGQGVHVHHVPRLRPVPPLQHLH